MTKTPRKGGRGNANWSCGSNTEGLDVQMRLAGEGALGMGLGASLEPGGGIWPGPLPEHTPNPGEPNVCIPIPALRPALTLPAPRPKLSLTQLPHPARTMAPRPLGALSEGPSQFRQPLSGLQTRLPRGAGLHAGHPDSGTVMSLWRQKFQHFYLVLRHPPHPQGGPAFSSQIQAPRASGASPAASRASCGQTAGMQTRPQRWGPGCHPEGRCCLPSASGRALFPLQTQTMRGSQQRRSAGASARTCCSRAGRPAVTRVGHVPRKARQPDLLSLWARGKPPHARQDDTASTCH